MPQITPIRLEFAVVIQMDEFMSQRLLHLLAAPKMVLAEQDRAVLMHEASRTVGFTWEAQYLLGRVDTYTGLLLDPLEHEDDSRAWQR